MVQFGWMTTRFPIVHRSRITTPGHNSQSLPIRTSGPTKTWAWSTVRSPTTALSPITTQGPTLTLSPRRAVGETTAVGWTPGAGRGIAGANFASTAEMAREGSSHRIAGIGVAPKCLGTTTAPARLLFNCGAYRSSASQAISDESASSSPATPVIRVLASPRTTPPTHLAISARGYESLIDAPAPRRLTSPTERGSPAPPSIPLAPESFLGPSGRRIPILILTGRGANSAQVRRPCLTAGASQNWPGKDSGPSSGPGTDSGPSGTDSGPSGSTDTHLPKCTDAGPPSLAKLALSVASTSAEMSTLLSA